MNSIRLRSPGDVVAVLPYQLGYHPHDSLVVVALRDRAVVLVERVDLPTAAAADEVTQVLVPPLLHEDPDAVLLVAYETRAGDGRPGLEAVGRELDEAGITVLDRMVVRDGRWFAVDCGAGCCPPDGSPVPSPADTPAVAEFVGLGISPLPGRGALAALVAADPERTPAVARAIRQRAIRQRASRQRAVRQPEASQPEAGQPEAGQPEAGQPEAGRGGLGRTAARFEALSAWAVALGPGAASSAGSTSAEATADRTGADALRAEARDDATRSHRTADDSDVVDALGPERVALLVDSLHDVHLRDGLVAWLCPGSLPLDCLSPDVVDAVRSCLPAPATTEGAAGPRGPRPQGGEASVVGRRHLLRLQHLVRAVPDEHAAPLLTVLANLAWWLGDGALSRTCVERALGASPGYRLALLLERMLDLGVRPRGPSMTR